LIQLRLTSKELLMRRRTAPRDNGQAAALVVGVIAVLLVIVVAVGSFGRHLGDLARAHTAADAAALAGASAGRAAAAEMAAANGARLAAFSVIGTDVVVTVTVGRVSVSARAAIPGPPVPTLVGNGENRHFGSGRHRRS
jgi:hypothetical protein